MTTETVSRLVELHLQRLTDQFAGAMGDGKAAGMVNVDEVVELREVWQRISDKIKAGGAWETLDRYERDLLQEAEIEERQSRG